MITFKQIIGRRTRLRPDCGKEFFTIIDFRGATSKCADPDFDGAPVVILDNSDNCDDEGSSATDDDDDFQFIDEHGKLITENLIDYTRKNILGHFATLESFPMTLTTSI